MPPPITSMFVYGTLQRGQVRERMWPCRPLSIQEACVRGRLFDLGPYPALLPPDAGSVGDRIAGEVWSFTSEQMPEVLRVLDQIEGYRQPGEQDLYHRVEIAFETATGQPGAAFTYFYARPDGSLDEARRVGANEHGICRWPRSI